MQTLLLNITEPGNRQETQKSIVNTARTHLSADWGAMLTLNPITQQFYGPCVVATKLREKDVNTVQSWLAKIALQAYKNGEAYVNKFSETPDLMIDAFKLRDTASIRVITLHTKRGHKPMAVLFLGFNHEQRDVVDEDENLTTLLQQSSLVLENLWLLGRYRAVIKIGQKLNRRLNSYRELFEKLRVEVASIIDTSYFFMLAVHQPQTNTLDRYFSIEEGEPVVQVEMKFEGACEAVIKKGRSLQSFNLGQDKNWEVDHVDLIGKAKPDSKSVIFEPLIFRGEVLGVLTVQHTEPNAYDDEDIRIMKLLGNQVALALSNLRLFKYLETLNDVGQRLTENLTSDDLLTDVAKEVRKATHADIVTLYPYLPAENRFAQAVYSGDLRQTGFLQPTILPDNIAWLTLKLGKPVWAKDSTKLYGFLGGDPKRRRGKFEELEEIASIAAVGLRIGNENVGVMFVNFRVKQRFPAPQQQLILGLAHYAAIAIKNYRKYTALSQRRFDDLWTLQKIDRQTRQTPRLSEVLRTILDGAVDRIPAADASSIFLFNQRTGQLEAAASMGRSTDAQPWLALPVKDGKSIPAWVYENVLPVCVDNVKIDPKWLEHYPTVKTTLSELCVPILDKDRVVGVLNLESRNEKAFTKEDEEFVSTLTGQAGLAIRNAQLYEQAESARTELETLQDVAQEITIQEGDPDRVMQLILKQARVLLGAEMGALQLYDGIRPGKVYLSESNTPDGEPIIRIWEARDDEQPAKLGTVQRVAERRESHITKDDAVKDPYYSGSADYHSEITVPLISRSGDLIGVLDLESPRLYAFDDDDLKVLEAFARQAIIAIQYAQVYSRALFESERFRLLSEAGRDLGELTDIKQIDQAYRVILAKVSEFNDGEIIIRRFDESTQELVLKDVLNSHQTPPLKSIQISKGVNGQVARERRTIVLHDLNDIPEGVSKPLGDNPSVGSLVITPIQVQKTRYYGNLVLSHAQSHSLSSPDISLLEGLAQQLAITIHRLEMVEAKREAEQQAKDLELVSKLGQSSMEIAHRLGNSLGLIKFYLADARRELEAGEINREAVKEELARIEADVLDVLSMNKGLKNQVAEFGKVGVSQHPTMLSVKALLEDPSWIPTLPENVQIQWELPDELPQVNVVPGQLVDILRNLVANAIEVMPEGGNINIRAFNVHPFVYIEVEDSGPGVPLSDQDNIFKLFFSTKKSSGFGLWSARRYARANGGDLTLENRPGEASTFVLRLPMAKGHPIKTPGRILIVDDEEKWRRALRMTLQRAGFHAEAAGTVTQAWKLLSENPYDLAILDISMSAGNRSDDEGMKILAQLNEQSFLSTMKVVMLSAYGTQEQMRRAFERYRVTDFLSKEDFFDNPSAFVETVMQILDIRPDSQSSSSSR